MVGESGGWTLASWIIESFSDPELLVVLLAGIVALGGFRVSARVREFTARGDSAPADDLI